ncbi:terminase family protein [Nevskia sp.]|uniref:terminase large subunit domain-containing protein n=1 Tax=Nevskia sp. TaxID=1929292 RepID=UPI0025E169A4|nr:terminase family protein [Nevskia sp.]
MIAPDVLLPYQQRWVADESPVAVCEKSRRVGLSWAEACASVLDAGYENGMDCWYVGYNKDMAQEFIRDCAFWAKHFNVACGEAEEVLIDDEEKDILSFQIRFASGKRITALSSRPSNLRGKQGRVILDEAAFHQLLKELLKAAIALLMWGGKVRIVSTHDGEENEFNTLVKDIRAGRVDYSLHRITLDDALGEGLFKRICLKLNKEWSPEAEAAWRDELVKFYRDAADEELFCVPSKGGGVWLPRVLIEARMVKDRPVVRWRAPDGMELWPEHTLKAEVRDFCDAELRPQLALLDPNRPSCFGLDFARVSDLTVIAPLQIGGTLRRDFPFLVELGNTPFKAQEQILFYMVDRLPRFSHGMLDAGGNGAYLAEVAKQRYGEMQITEVKFSETWYRENTGPFKAGFEDDSISLPADDEVLNDLSAFRLVKGVPRVPDLRVTDKRGQKRHGDAGIAMLLSHAASRQEIYQPYRYDAVKLTRQGGVHGASDGDDFRGVRITGGFRSRSGVI